MARNRKYQTTATRFAPALRAFLLCALIGGSGVGYVWQKSRIDGLSRQIKEREQKLRAFLESERVCARTDDDKTLVIACCPGSGVVNCVQHLMELTATRRSTRRARAVSPVVPHNFVRVRHNRLERDWLALTDDRRL